MSGTQFISNPFQVLGVSDPVSPEPKSAPVEPASPTVDTAHNAAQSPLHAPKIDEIAPIIHPAPITAPAMSATPVSPVAVPSSANKHLSFLHHLGTFLLDSVLPVVLQIGVPILEKEI